MNETITTAIYQYLDQHDITYHVHHHEPVFTVEEAQKIDSQIPGIQAKTLLVFTEKTKRMYLVSLEGTKKLEQSRIKELTGERVRFASQETLEELLRVTPGSVSPFGLIFDTENAIAGYILDNDIASSEMVSFHPNTNNQTIGLDNLNFQAFLDSISHKVISY